MEMGKPVCKTYRKKTDRQWSAVVAFLFLTSFLWANYARHIYMMKNIVADTSHNGASNSTQPTASHDHEVSFTFLYSITNGLTRFTTTHVQLIFYLQNKNEIVGEWEASERIPKGFNFQQLLVL